MFRLSFVEEEIESRPVERYSLRVADNLIGCILDGTVLLDVADDLVARVLDCPVVLDMPYYPV